ncbi:hypothetical protein SETIT_8G113100v2 [Setaria italica]|uniref:Uncharacterized protein n=2 Tax=Setaria TaxID=4554 RepID=A0A368S6L6_SETIT|nr:hypothetical protein SETIT_8G113100v2 [Setaria italica]TKW00561.1 hypothetical protein SEVIR_8G118700v2 [Setaria viridis]
MGGLSDLDFGPGLEIQRTVQSHFSSPVSFSPAFSSYEFLVVSFGRSAICLNADPVGLILQSCLRGIDTDFRVVYLSGAMYRFSVFSKEVGFLVYKLGFFKWKSFDVYFALWGSGGPNWRHDYDLWIAEQEAEWTIAMRKSTRKSYATAVKAHIPASKSVFNRLSHPDDYFVKNFSRDLHGHRSEQSSDRSSCLRSSSSRVRSPPKFQAPDQRCFRCLSLNLRVAACKSQIRCCFCFGFGHISRFCRASLENSKAFRPKPSPSGGPSGSGLKWRIKVPPLPLASKATDPSPSSETPPHPHSPATAAADPPPPPPMANFAIDPRPHLPPGFTWAPQVLPYVPPPRPRACLALNLERTNDDLAIALLTPPVTKDYIPMAHALQTRLPLILCLFRSILDKVLVDPLDASEQSDNDVVILDKMPPTKTPRKTPRKPRARKPKGPLESKFLRRSSRLNKDLNGFKDQASVQTDGAQEAVGEPLAIMSLYQGVSEEASTTAPHLPVEVVQAIGTGFLKMQSQTVSAEALLASDDD